MADLFDILGRRIEGSLEEISDAFAKASTKVTDTAKEQAIQVGALGEMIKRLDKIIKDTENRDTKVKEKAPRVGKVQLDPKDADLFRRAAEAFDRANKNRREEKIDLAPTERALNSIKGGINKLIQVAESRDFVSAAESMMSKLASQTLGVQDKGLTAVADKILGHLENSSRTSTKSSNKQTTIKDKKNLKGDSGFNGELRKLVKAGLSKGSIYTHDFGTQSLLTEIMNDGKVAIAALRTIVNTMTGMTVPKEDAEKLKNADLRQRRLSTLSKNSIVTQSIADKFNRRRKGDKNDTSEEIGKTISGDGQGANTIRQLLRGLKAKSSPVESKKLDEMFEKAAMVLRNQDLLTDTHKENLENTIKRLKSAEAAGGPEEVEKARKQAIEDLAGFGEEVTRGYRNLENFNSGTNKVFRSITKFADVVEKVGSAMRSLSAISPSNNGLMPAANFADPGQFIKDTGKQFADFNKELVGATFAGLGAKGDPFAGAKGGADKLNIALAETGTNIRTAYVQTGALAEEFQGTYLKNLKRGITEFTTLNRVTKIGLSLGTIIGVKAEATAEEFADWNQYLGASADQLDTIGRRTVQISRATGVTGDNLLIAVKAAREMSNDLRNAGTFSSEAAASLIELSANARKFGVDEQVNRLSKGLRTASGFYNDIDDKTRSLLVQAAGKRGRIKDLQTGGLNNKAGFKDIAIGLEDVFREMSGGFGSDEIGKMTTEQLTMLNLRLQSAFGVQAGELQKMIQTNKESGMTAEDRLMSIEKKLSGTLSTKDREMLLAQKEQTKSLAAKEKLDAQIAKGEGLKEKLNALDQNDLAGQRAVIESQLGGAVGVQDYLDSISSELKKSSGFDTAKIEKKFGNTKDPAIKAALDDAKKQKASAEEAMAKAAARLDALKNSGITSGKEFADALDEAKEAQGGLADVQGLFNETSVLKKAEFEQNKLNLGATKTLTDAINKLTLALGAQGLLLVGNTLAVGGLLVGIGVGVKNFILGLKNLFSGFGKLFGKLGLGSRLTQAGEAVAGAGGRVASVARGGASAARSGIGSVRGAGMLATLSKTLKPLSKTLGALSKTLGPLAAPISAIVGGVTGFMESGSLGGTLMGVLTGDSKTGSFLSEYIGLEKGGVGDKALGVGGAAVHGAGLGAGIGLLLAPFTGGASVPIAAAIGAVVGGLTELFKIFMESDIGKKILEIGQQVKDFFIGTLWKTIMRIKKSFEPVVEKLGNLWSKISSRVIGFVDKIKEKFETFVEKIKEKVMPVFEAFAERFQRGIERISGWIEDGIEFVMPYIEWFVDVGIEMIGMAFDGIANQIGFVIDVIDTGIFTFDLFVAQLKDTFNAVSSIPGMLMGKMMKAIYDNATAAGRLALDAAGFKPEEKSTPPAESEVAKVMKERQKKEEKDIKKMTPKAPGPNAAIGGGFETQMMNDAKRRMVDDIAIRIGPKIPKGVSPATHYQLAEKIANELKKPGYSDGEFKTASETIFKKYLPEALKKKSTVADPATPETPETPETPAEPAPAKPGFFSRAARTAWDLSPMGMAANATSAVVGAVAGSTPPTPPTPAEPAAATPAPAKPGFFSRAAQTVWDVSPMGMIANAVTGGRTAPGGAKIQDAAEQVRTNQTISDNELRAIEAGNARLAVVERNTQQTADEVNRLANIMEKLMYGMVGKPDRVAPSGAETRVPKAAPTNFYQANMSPISLPGMGGLVPN